MAVLSLLALRTSPLTISSLNSNWKATREIPSSTIYPLQKSTITTRICQSPINRIHLISPTSLGTTDNNLQQNSILINPSIPNHSRLIILKLGITFNMSILGFPWNQTSLSRSTVGLHPLSVREELISTIKTRPETLAWIERTSLLQRGTDLILYLQHYEVSEVSFFS